MAGPMGWSNLPGQVEALLAKLPAPTFAAAAPNLVGIGDGKNVFLWEAEQQVLGSLLPCLEQKRGTCVAYGLARAIEDLIFSEIHWGQEAEGWKGRISTEILYAGSRVEIGKGQIGGERDDGSMGSWAAEFVQKYGVLNRGVYGSIDLTNADDELACKWGARGVGVPDGLEPLVRQHPIKDITQITSYADARDAIASGHPVTAASSVGFTEQRDANGFCVPKGRWDHQMMYRGAGIAKGGVPFLVQQQSWGTHSPTGPDRVTLEDGRSIMLPSGCFCVRAEHSEKQFKSGDCWTYAGLTGWRRRHQHI
jgi:hypothetical protein